MYDISEYDMLILFFYDKNHSIFFRFFLYISPILFNIFEFIRDTSVDTC
jgi:hypothetical protein